MQQTKLSKQESPLLDSAISRLRPGVFSHPVWVRFGNKNETAPAGTIKNLFTEAEKLKQKHPSDACQVLLICSVYQNYFGQTNSALSTIQQAQQLAQKTGLAQEHLWALWGASAICVQHNDFESAARYLDSLKRLLDQQNEWVLANYVDTVRQALQQSTTRKMGLQDNHQNHQSVENLLSLTFRWLNLWGFSGQSLNQEIFNPTGPAPSPGRNQPLFSIERWQGRWRNISLIFKGEIKLHWEDVNAGSGNKHSSFWGNILKIFRGERKSKETAAKIIEVESESEFIDPAPTQISNEHSDTSIDPLVIEQNPVQEPDKKPASTDQELTTITVSVQMLGFFNMSIQDVDIKLPSSRSLLLLKYLIHNHKQNTPRDVLMELFWPDLEPEKARNNLNVAIYTLRKNLREYTDFPIIHYEDSAYGVVNEVQIWLDVDEFELLVKVGRQLEARDEMSKAVSKYEAAISLYQGDFLEDNPYEGWTALTRERLRMAYLDTLDRLNQIYYNQQHYAMCITLSQLILTRDRCREDAHFMLMRCYSHQGQDHLALRQYQVCEDALRLELDVTPSPETIQLFEQIRQHKEI